MALRSRLSWNANEQAEQDARKFSIFNADKSRMLSKKVLG